MTGTARIAAKRPIIDCSGTNHNDVAHAGHHLTCVFDGLPRLLAIACVQINCRTTELVHTSLGSSNAYGLEFFEHHDQRTVRVADDRFRIV